MQQAGWLAVGPCGGEAGAAVVVLPVVGRWQVAWGLVLAALVAVEMWTAVLVVGVGKLPALVVLAGLVVVLAACCVVAL